MEWWTHFIKMHYGMKATWQSDDLVHHHSNIIWSLKRWFNVRISAHISLLTETLVSLGDIHLEMHRIVSCLKQPESTRSTLIQASNCSRRTYHQTIFKIHQMGFLFFFLKKESFPCKPIDALNLKLIQITNYVALHTLNYTSNQNKSIPMSWGVWLFCSTQKCFPS